MLFTALYRYKIPLADCRAQAYDNGFNKSEKIKGVQACSLEKNNLAFYSPYSSFPETYWCKWKQNKFTS